MKYLLALDQGTTSSRAFLFTLEGKPVALAQRPFRQLYPRPGWVEHDPLEIWESQLWAAREALREAGVGAGALGLEEVGRAWREAARFHPQMPEEEREALWRGWRRAVARVLGFAEEGA